ncbi:hypothetical protein ACFC26_07905 [Kitasatospora purpeofusca]|uniref:hypothetical protein n=1 Tax=Kitasatospora purpeofusca TaxID=67352 RepID=UPI0035DDEE08
MTRSLTDVLADVWTEVQLQDSAVPPAVFTVTRTTPPADHGPDQWRWDAPVVEISRADLIAGPDGVLTSVLHTAAHLANRTRGVGDVSRRGVYHNAEFRKAAEVLGLIYTEPASNNSGFRDVMLDPDGWTSTDVMVSLRSALAEEVPTALATVAPVQRSQGATRVTARCDCPRSILIAPSILEQGGIRCEVCRGCFVVAS